MSTQIKTMEQLRDIRLLYEKKIPAFGYMIILAVVVLLVGTVIWSINTPKTYIITAGGIVQSENKNYVMSPYGGKISEINIKEGDLVEEGQILFTVKSTEMNLQLTQLEEQKKSYQTKIGQYKKLVQSIKDDTNYFDSASAGDSLYYSQFEAYKSQIAQSQIDVSTYQAYGYTDEQIENQLVINQAKVAEIYYAAIQSAETSITEANMQLESIEAQCIALNQGQEEYVVTAPQTGIIHMMSDYKKGMVVQSALAVASISTQQDEYEIVAYLNPEDTARTKVGDKVDIAVSGLTQSVYGTIPGQILRIDSDITTSQSSEGETSSYFKVYIKPDNTYLVSKQGNKAVISNGMSVEARIQYDEVTYFNYVMEALGVLTR